MRTLEKNYLFPVTSFQKLGKVSKRIFIFFNNFIFKKINEGFRLLLKQTVLHKC